MKYLGLFFFLLWVTLGVNHPFMLCVSLILYSWAISTYLFVFFSLWAMTMVILIFLGGVLIVFLYVSTLSNSDKILLTGGGFGEALGATALIFPLSSWEEQSAPLLSEDFFSYSLMYSWLGSGALGFAIFYLLISLFSVVKFSDNFKGALIKTL